MRTAVGIIIGIIIGFASIVAAQECLPTVVPVDAPNVAPADMATVIRVSEDGSFAGGSYRGCLRVGLCTDGGTPTTDLATLATETLTCGPTGPCSLTFIVTWVDGSVGTYNFD